MAVMPILAELELTDPHHSRLALSGTWGASIPDHDAPGMYAVERGTVWLRTGFDAPVPLHAGDLALLPRGAAHAVTSAPGGAAPPVDQVCARAGVAHGAAIIAIGGEDEALVDTFCFRLTSPVTRALVRVAPDLVVLRAQAQEAWTSHVARALSALARCPGSDAEDAIPRLGETLFATALRAACEVPVRSTDTAVSTALVLIHGDPARRWTARTLARRVGCSRAAFYTRFTRAVGASPMAYLTRVRMEHAAHLFQSGKHTRSEVADMVGYTSVSAFSVAFKRWSRR
jgi:AraC-like DNA-binding protein